MEEEKKWGIWSLFKQKKKNGKKEKKTGDLVLIPRFGGWGRKKRLGPFLAQEEENEEEKKNKGPYSSRRRTEQGEKQGTWYLFQWKRGGGGGEKAQDLVLLQAGKKYTKEKETGDPVPIPAQGRRRSKLHKEAFLLPRYHWKRPEVAVEEFAALLPEDSLLLPEGPATAGRGWKLPERTGGRRRTP